MRSAHHHVQDVLGSSGLDGGNPIVIALTFVVFLGWMGCYGAMIWQGFKDKAYGMPLLAVGFMWSWDFTFGFIYPSEVAGLRWMDRIWVLVDSTLLLQVFLYGRRYLPIPRLRNWLVLVTLTVWASAFGFVICFTNFTQMFDGFVLAYMIDALISITYCVIIFSRPKLQGLTIWAVVCHFIATAATMIGTFVGYELTLSGTACDASGGCTLDSPLNPYSILLFVIALVFDIVAFRAILRTKRGLDPWGMGEEKPPPDHGDEMLSLCAPPDDG